MTTSRNSEEQINNDGERAKWLSKSYIQWPERKGEKDVKKNYIKNWSMIDITMDYLNSSGEDFLTYRY